MAYRRRTIKRYVRRSRRMPFRRRRYYPKRRRLGYARGRSSRYSRRALPSARAVTPTHGTWVPSFSARTNMTWQTLYMNELVLPQLSSFVGDRRSSFLYLRGISLTQNLSNEINIPIILHMAIVQDRDNNNSDLDRRQNFFRDTTSLTARAHPFNDWISGNAYDYRMTMNPICSDHYRIITHEKHILDPKNPGTLNYRRPYFKLKKKYYKINRRIAFDNVTDSINWRPFYICYWWQPVNPADYVPTTGQTGPRFTYKTEVVFKNIL